MARGRFRAGLPPATGSAGPFVFPGAGQRRGGQLFSWSQVGSDAAKAARDKRKR
jgi:hypothetical protein